MKLKEKLVIALALLTLDSSLSQLFSQTTVSTPIVGFVKSPITGTATSGGSSYFNFVPVQLNKTPVFRGTATATGTTVSLTGASLVSGNLNSGTYPTHYLIIQSGTGAGLISDVVSNTANSVVTSDDLSAHLSGAQVAVIPHVLLVDLLGQGGSLVVAGGSAASADLVYLVGSDGSFKSYYYKTGLSAGWKDAATAASVSGLIVYPSESILVERRQASSTEALTLTGQVALNTMRVDFNSGFTSAASPFPVSLKLTDLTSSLAGGSAATADQVFFVDPATGQLKAHYYKTGLAAGWKDAASGSPADTTRDISSGFIVQKVAAPSAFSQNVP